MSVKALVLNRNKNLPVILLIALIVLYPLLFIWQGLDFTDMGYWLTGYQQFLESPESINEGLLNWLTYAIGFIVETVAGKYVGVIAFKFAFVLVTWICVVLVYYVLRDCFKEKSKETILLTIAVTLLYVTKATENWIGYNNLTALLYLCGASLLYFGLVRSSRALIFAAAFILSASIFVRFPNLLGAGLIAGIGLFALVENTGWKVAAVNFLIFAGGFLVGFLALLFVIQLAGHLEYYERGLMAIFNIASDIDSHHSGSRLMALFFKDHIRAFFYGGLAIIAGIILAAAIRNFSSLVKWVSIILVAILSSKLLIISDMWKWTITGICYYVLLISIYCFYRTSPRKFLLSCLAFLILLIAPLGSSNGMRNSVYGMWLALPLALFFAMNFKEYFKLNSVVQMMDSEFLARMGVVSLTVLSVLSAYNYTYRDSDRRTTMKHTINHQLLRGVLTTSTRAQVVNELMGKVISLVNKQDVLLAYNEIPLLHYLTHTKPWLNNPWPMLYSPLKIDRLIKYNELNRRLPSIVIRATGNTSSRDWPSGDRTFGNQDRENESRDLFNHFIQRHDYKSVWENSYFQILRLGSPNM